jgi:hypothetical protein
MQHSRAGKVDLLDSHWVDAWTDDAPKDAEYRRGIQKENLSEPLWVVVRQQVEKPVHNLVVHTLVAETSQVENHAELFLSTSFRIPDGCLQRKENQANSLFDIADVPVMPASKGPYNRSALSIMSMDVSLSSCQLGLHIRSGDIARSGILLPLHARLDAIGCCVCIAFPGTQKAAASGLVKFRPWIVESKVPNLCKQLCRCILFAVAELLLIRLRELHGSWFLSLRQPSVRQTHGQPNNDERCENRDHRIL